MHAWRSSLESRFPSTTCSTFGLDTFTLAHGGAHAVAFWNVVGQVGLELGAVALGYHVGL
jgi:fluoride ion exporter CrcB/FEX